MGNRLKEWLATEGKGSFERTAPSNVLEGPRSSWKYVFDPMLRGYCFCTADSVAGTIQSRITSTLHTTMRMVARAERIRQQEGGLASSLIPRFAGAEDFCILLTLITYLIAGQTVTPVLSFSLSSLFSSSSLFPLSS